MIKMEDLGSDEKMKSADSAEPTKSEKVYENAKVLSNGTWAKFREMAEEFAETTTKMNELVKNERAQYMAALEALRRCEDRVTIEKTKREMFKVQRDNFIRLFIYSRNSKAKLLVEKSKVNRLVKETKKQSRINKALAIQLRDTKQVADQESRRRATSSNDFDKLLAAFHQMKAKELCAQQELSKCRYDILLCKELIERLQKCVAELEDKVQDKKELEISLENSKKANLVLNTMLDNQVRANELEKIENHTLKQRCLSFEDIVESLQQEIKDLNKKYQDASELAQSHSTRFDKSNKAWDQVLLAIEAFISAKNCGSPASVDSSLPEASDD